MLAANDLRIAAHTNPVDAAVAAADQDFRQAGKLVQVLTWH